MNGKAIHIRGAKQNNLKNLNIEIPLNQLTVVTGVSGSGKSTLAFDILYAEGQRRYVESFSAYAGNFSTAWTSPMSRASKASRRPSPSIRAGRCAPRGPPSAP
jgi:excinuclease ABC subunit A